MAVSGGVAGFPSFARLGITNIRLMIADTSLPDTAPFAEIMEPRGQNQGFVKVGGFIEYASAIPTAWAITSFV